MNQAQRNFLIKRIEDQVKASIEALKDKKPDAPNLNNYLLHQVLSGKLKIKPTEHIKKAIIKRALEAKEGENWMTGERNNYSGLGAKLFKLNVTDLIDVDAEYTRLLEEYKAASVDIDDKIRVLRVQSDTLITRIQLASDRTLDKMINEIDDMGDISLMDTKIRFLNA